MRVLLLTIAIALCSAITNPLTWTEDLQQCKYSRNDVVGCMIKYGDTDGDERLSVREINILKDSLLDGILERFFIFFFSIEHITRQCDFDQDGFIDERDFDLAINDCLATCERLHTFNRLICERAAARNYKPPHFRPAAAGSGVYVKH